MQSAPEVPSDPPAGARSSAAARRNREPVLKVLASWAASGERVLEIASGTGEHVLHFATAMPAVAFQPSDPDPAARASIDAWRQAAGLANVAPALDLDVGRRPWPVEPPDLVLCLNMIHIAPWQAAIDLFAGASQVLDAGGRLLLYGPFLQREVPTAPGNLAFDADLRARNPQWGLRDLADVRALATAAGMGAPRVVPMPANNLLVAWVKG
ncbi:MAG: DUF938 domain-containing protein [Burkholderiaceae bacterium]